MSRGTLIAIVLLLLSACAAPVEGEAAAELPLEDVIAASAVTLLPPKGGICSAVLLDDGTGMSARHCWDALEGGEVLDARGGSAERRRIARVWQDAEDIDQARFELEGGHEGGAPLCSSAPDFGEDIAIAGFGCEHEAANVHRGSVAHWWRAAGAAGVSTRGAGPCPGDSGAPVYREAGCVWGSFSGVNPEPPSYGVVFLLPELQP